MADSFIKILHFASEVKLGNAFGKGALQVNTHTSNEGNGKSWRKRVGNIPLTMENGNQLLFKGEELVGLFKKYLLTSPTTRYEMLSALKFSSEQMLELERNLDNVANAYTHTIRGILTTPS